MLTSTAEFGGCSILATAVAAVAAVAVVVVAVVAILCEKSIYCTFAVCILFPHCMQVDLAGRKTPAIGT